MSNPQTTDATRDYDTSKFLEQIKTKLPEAENKEEFLLKQIELAEKRRRDTEASFTKTRQEMLRLQSERDALKQKVSPQVKIPEEIDNLKYEDPERWRAEVNRLEQEARINLEQEVNTMAQKTAEQLELEERQKILRSFSAANPDFDITKPEVQDQIPPLYIKQLEAGKISFEDFLNKAKQFIEAPKKPAAKDIPPTDEVDLSKLPGGSTPKKGEAEPTLVERYENIVL